MDQLLAGTRAAISATFTAGEVPVDSTTPVTVEVTREDGTMVVAAGTATADPITGDGSYELVLTPAQLPTPDVLRARWTATIGGQVHTLSTLHEVVGGFYFELTELRAEAGLENTTKFPPALLADTRFWIADIIERVVGVPFVVRYDRITLDGVAGAELLLPRPYVDTVLGVRVGGVALSAPEVAALWVYPDGRLIRPSGTWGAGRRNVEVRYTWGYRHGDGGGPPADLRRAAIVAARDRLLSTRSGHWERATSMQNDAGTFTLAQAGADHPTGLPEVDAVIVGWRRRLRVPVIA